MTIQHKDPQSPLLIESELFYTETELDDLVAKHTLQELSDHQLLCITRLFSACDGAPWERLKQENPKAARALAALGLAYCDYSYGSNTKSLEALYHEIKNSPTFEFS